MNEMTFDEFAKLFGPTISKSFENLPNELHHTLLTEMHHQTQKTL